MDQICISNHEYLLSLTCKSTINGSIVEDKKLFVVIKKTHLYIKYNLYPTQMDQ